MARYCSPQLSVRTRLSPPYRATIRLKVFHGRNSISWAKSVLPVFIGDSRDHPGSLLRLQIVDTAFCSETRRTPGAQSRWPSVNRTAVIDRYNPEDRLHILYKGVPLHWICAKHSQHVAKRQIGIAPRNNSSHDSWRQVTLFFRDSS